MAGWDPTPLAKRIEILRGKDEKTARALAVYEEGLRRGVYCAGCGYVFTDGDVIYRRKLNTPITEKVQYGQRCRECVAKWHPSWLRDAKEPVPCAGGCGALISHWCQDRYRYKGGAEPYFTTCSQQCARQVRNGRRRKAASTTTCAACGEPFEPQRSDSRYCSNACRQRAYRERAA